MPEESLTPLQVRTVLYVIKKHKWKILTLFLSTVITVAIGSLLVEPIYRASAQLLVKPGREDLYISPTAGSPAVIDYPVEGERVNTEIAILKSRSLVIGVVDRITVSRLYDYPDRTIKGRLFKEENKKRETPAIENVYESVLNSLEVSGAPRSNVINVTLDWPDPDIAARLVNTLVDQYLDHHVRVHTNPETYNLFEDQAKKWERELQKSEKELEAFKRRYSITSLPEQRTILLGRLSETESARKRTESEVQETMELVATLEAQLSNLDQQVQLQETVDRRSETLNALKARLLELELQGLKEEIGRVKQMIAEEEKKKQVVVVSGKSPIRQDLERDLFQARARLEGLKARKNTQELQIANHREELRGLDGFEKRLNELERQTAITEGNYRLYLTKFQEAKISESMDREKIANVRVIQPAVPPSKPIGPKKRMNVLIGGFLGLLAGIGMAFLIEFIHPVFRTREDVDQFLGLPVLVNLPKEKTG